MAGRTGAVKEGRWTSRARRSTFACDLRKSGPRSSGSTRARALRVLRGRPCRHAGRRPSHRCDRCWHLFPGRPLPRAVHPRPGLRGPLLLFLPGRALHLRPCGSQPRPQVRLGTYVSERTEAGRFFLHALLDSRCSFCRPCPHACCRPFFPVRLLPSLPGVARAHGDAAREKAFLSCLSHRSRFCHLRSCLPTCGLILSPGPQHRRRLIHSLGPINQGGAHDPESGS